MRFTTSLAGLVLCLCFACATVAADPAPEPAVFRSVRFVYLVSADREPRDEYVAAIAAAAREVQRFYAGALDGRTFTLNTPLVEVVRSDRPAAWFYAHDSGGPPDNWGYDNALSEARRLLGAGHGQDFIWVIYSDGPGDKGRGGSGVAVMPEDDLLGLVGRHPTQKQVGRWVFGMAHELGHALGLGHPPDLEAVPRAVMGRGFYDCFPDRCELTAEDRAVLAPSPFLRRPEEGPAAPPVVLATYPYEGGAFMRVRDGARVVWHERGAGGGRFTFEEREASPEVFVLHDGARGYTIRIPRRGGLSEISNDGGRTFHALYVVGAGVAPR